MPSSGLTDMPLVRKQAASNTRSSLAPAGSTLGSPVGSANPRFLSVIFSIFFFFLLFERDMRGHRAIVKYRFICFVIICRHSDCTYGGHAACTEISQIGAIRNAGSKPTQCSHLTKQNLVATALGRRTPTEQSGRSASTEGRGYTICAAASRFLVHRDWAHGFAQIEIRPRQMLTT